MIFIDRCSKAPPPDPKPLPRPDPLPDAEGQTSELTDTKDVKGDGTEITEID